MPYLYRAIIVSAVYSFAAGFLLATILWNLYWSKRFNRQFDSLSKKD